MAKNKNAKKIILVNRDFQLRYAGAAVGVGFLTSSLSIFVILFPLYFFEIIRNPRFLPTPILWGMGLAIAINIMALFGMGIVITHRIAGPMYSIVRHLRRIGSGYFGVYMRLREGDELRYVVRNVNDLIDSLKYLTTQDIESLDRVLKTLQSGDIPTTNNELESLRSRIHERLEIKTLTSAEEKKA